MTKEKTNAPPLYMPGRGVYEYENETETETSIPSSGVIVRVKFRRSAGSGKWVTIVEGRSSSVKSCVQREVGTSQYSIGEFDAYLFVLESVQHSSWAFSSTPPPRSSSCSISYFRVVNPPNIKL